MSVTADSAPAARKLTAMLEFWSDRCYAAQSRLYGYLLERICADVAVHGPCTRVLVDYVGDPVATEMPMRFLAAVHRLVLQGSAPELARFYASAGGWFDPRTGEPAESRPFGEDPWPAFQDVVAEHGHALRSAIRQPRQLSEVASSVGLLVGFLRIAELTSMPMRLFEVGAGAGFNLRWDMYRYETSLWSLGPPSARVTFADPWLETPPGLVTVPELLQRRGCDPRPTDPNDAEHVIDLRSFVWPDDDERARRLGGAIELAREHPVAVDRASAAPWITRQLAQPVADSTTVVFHAGVMPYLDPLERDRFEAAVASAGARATATAPVAHLAFESNEDHSQSEVRLNLWPHQVDEVVATTDHLGLPVTCL